MKNQVNFQKKTSILRFFILTYFFPIFLESCTTTHSFCKKEVDTIEDSAEPTNSEFAKYRFKLQDTTVAQSSKSTTPANTEEEETMQAHSTPIKDADDKVEDIHENHDKVYECSSLIEEKVEIQKKDSVDGRRSTLFLWRVIVRSSNKEKSTSLLKEISRFFKQNYIKHPFPFIKYTHPYYSVILVEMLTNHEAALIKEKLEKDLFFKNMNLLILKSTTKATQYEVEEALKLDISERLQRKPMDLKE